MYPINLRVDSDLLAPVMASGREMYHRFLSSIEHVERLAQRFLSRIKGHAGCRKTPLERAGRRRADVSVIKCGDLICEN